MTALIMLVAGVAMIITSDTLASAHIVVGGGILFILAGIANMLFFLGARDRHGHVRTGAFGSAVGWVASAAAIVLGTAMLLFQQTFLPLVSFIFAVMVLFAAIYQTCLLLFGTRPMRLSPWFFIVPMLLLVAASYIFLKRGDINTTDQHIMLISGCAFTLFGIVSIVEGIIIAHGNRRIDKAAQAKPEPAHTPDYNIEKDTTAYDLPTEAKITETQPTDVRPAESHPTNADGTDNTNDRADFYGN